MIYLSIRHVYQSFVHCHKYMYKMQLCLAVLGTGRCIYKFKGTE